MKRTIFLILIACVSLMLIGCPGGTTPSNPPASSFLTMINVPGGTFQRDATATNTSTVDGFSMSQYEITVDQYLDVVGGTNPSINFLTVVNGPVQYLNWFHTLVFCNKLSARENLTPVYTISGSTNPDVWGAVPMADTDLTFAAWNAVTANWNANGYRLPTEMEFEWAMMGATSDRSNGYTGVGINTTGYQKGYAGSTEVGTAYVNLGNYAWYNTNAGTTTHTIGTKLPNELGFYDLSGNVREYCWDWYATPLPAGELDNYHGGPAATYRVLKGGDWDSSYLACEVDRRGYLEPYYDMNIYGFRVVRN